MSPGPNYHLYDLCIYTYTCLSSQEDDIDGVHIVAFAEEEDPGKSMLNQ